MDARKYREYSKEFKLETLELLKRGEKSASQLERELGITPGMLVKWRTRYSVLARDGQALQLGPSDLKGAKAEIRRRQRELAAVEEEREIQNKYWASSREKAHEVRLHRSARFGILGGSLVQRLGGRPQWLLCLARSPRKRADQS